MSHKVRLCWLFNRYDEFRFFKRIAKSWDLWEEILRKVQQKFICIIENENDLFFLNFFETFRIFVVIVEFSHFAEFDSKHIFFSNIIEIDEKVKCKYSPFNHVSRRLDSEGSFSDTLNARKDEDEAVLFINAIDEIIEFKLPSIYTRILNFVMHFKQLWICFINYLWVLIRTPDAKDRLMLIPCRSQHFEFVWFAVRHFNNFLAIAVHIIVIAAANIKLEICSLFIGWKLTIFFWKIFLSVWVF